MKKRKRERVLALILVFVLASAVSVANATLIISRDPTTDVYISDVVVVSITSSDGAAFQWGVYLDPTSDFGNGYAKLEYPAVTGNTGSQGAVIGSTAAGAGHDYKAGGGGRSAGLFSTVDFVGLAAGAYTVRLYDSYGTTGGSLGTVDITVLPEPATLALLGLGGLLLMRRRK